MGVPRRTAVKNRPSSERVLNPELGVMLPNLPADHGSSTGEVWSGIWTITKYVLFFCLGMVVGALFLHSNDVQKKCFESMVAIGFSSQRGREICYKNQPSISGSFRFDCMPRNANAQDCKKRGCIWDESVQGVPYCYFPDKYGSYSNANVTIENGLISAYMLKKIKSPYPEDVDILLFEACSETESRLHVKITDVSRDRFEPFYPKVPDFHCKTLKNSQFQVKISEGKMGFKVLRSSNNRVIFDSEDIGSLIYANQFLQVNARLPSGSVLYGIGERQSPMHINNGTFQTFTLWNRDAAPTDKINLYGSHPFLLIREPFDQPESFKWHGLFFLNSNAMDIITQPGPAITFRTIGGILDFYWFMGETPSLVTQQYFEVIGRPRMPPYWALGFHLCRFGYESLDKTIVVWNRTRSAGIPFDVQWNDLDYMDHNNDFTVSPKFEKLPEFVNMLHSIGMHYIPLIDPGVSAGEKKGQYEPYDYGIELNIFVEDENKKPFMGKVWNSVSTVWPDFTNPQTILYWLQMLRNLHDKVPFDGAWIDMNEPSNFYSGSKNGCAKNSLNYPPYVPNVLGGQLFSNTLCPSSKQYKGLHYDLHNLYGISEAVVTSFVLENIRDLKRPVTISRSTFPGHGHYAAHWTGDVFSTWSDMKLSIAQMLMFNMFGIPFVGADICGFNGNTTAELCARWSQLGAFYPFSRNHNSDDTIEQDPVALGSTVVNAAKRALEIRYSLLPYLYYLFFDAHVHGKTVARPVFYEFPNDVNTHQLESQFMWGSCILFVPVLDEGKITVNGYFPAGMWYDWNTNDTLNVDKSLLKTLSAPLDTIPLFVRGGCILPTQLPKATTTESRQTPVTIKVYLDHNGSGHGSAYFDDGDFVYAVDEGNYTLINYSAKDKTLIGSPVKAKFSTIPPLKTVIIHGDCDDVVHVTVNNKETNKFFFNKKACILSVQVNASLLEALKISWKG